ncbi:hypothetical protein QYF36_021752 [Acer negundo]|nr:hypothetical protein QYF36_021752 [Acer negundo]
MHRHHRDPPEIKSDDKVDDWFFHERSGNKVTFKLPLIQTKSNPYAKHVPSKCFRCGMLGHRSNECLMRKGVNMASGLDDSREESKNEDDEEYGL